MDRRALLAAPAALTIAADDPRAAATGPVLVELFTSQGCSSCPPADRLLAELAAVPGIVALAFHVTYWDRLGWKDTLGDERFTRRQHNYARRFRSGQVYTPQAVIQGEVDVVGSDSRIRQLALKLADRAAVPWLEIEPDGKVVLPAITIDRPAAIWATAFDAQHRVEIRRGENAGRTIDYANVVRELVDLGSWDGAAGSLALPALLRTAGRGLVVAVQDDTSGRLLALGRTTPAA